MELIFEPLSSAHEKDVMDIFNYYAENSFAAYPERRLPDAFFSKFLEISKGYPAFAVKSENGIIGFCMLRPYNPFPVFKGTAEISYFFKEGHTGKGIGGKALTALEDAGRKMGIKKILAEISSENQGSIGFHKRHGFCECGNFEGIGNKFGKEFGIVWMIKEL